jgi:hypothetical protein
MSRVDVIDTRDTGFDRGNERKDDAGGTRMSSFTITRRRLSSVGFTPRRFTVRSSRQPCIIIADDAQAPIRPGFRPAFALFLSSPYRSKHHYLLPYP